MKLQIILVEVKVYLKLGIINNYKKLEFKMLG